MLRDNAICVFLSVAIALTGCTEVRKSASPNREEPAAQPSEVFGIPNDQAGFTAHVAKLLRAAMPDASVSVKSPLIVVTASASEPDGSQVNLDRVWAYCVSERASCAPTVTRFVTNVAASLRDKNQPIERSMIRLVVRSASYLEEIRQATAATPEAALVATRFAGDLWLACVADLPRSTKFLSAGDLSKLGLSEDAAIALGKQNLASLLRPMAEIIRDAPAKAFGYLEGGEYESSRVLLHDDWAPLAQALNGQLVVTVPESRLVLYGDAARPNALEAMTVLARRIMIQAERPISPTLLKWTPTGWTTVTP